MEPEELAGVLSLLGALQSANKRLRRQLAEMQQKTAEKSTQAASPPPQSSAPETAESAMRRILRGVKEHR